MENRKFASDMPRNRLQHKRNVIDCQGGQGRPRGKSQGPEEGGERASRALGPPFPFPLVLGPCLPPGPSLDPLAVHHTALMLESAD